MPDTEGKLSMSGAVDAVKNPEPFRALGLEDDVRLGNVEVTARYDANGKITVRVTGHAGYLNDRSASYSIEVDPKEHPSVQRALESIMSAYAQQAASRARRAAYEAISVAERKGEL